MLAADLTVQLAHQGLGGLSFAACSDNRSRDVNGALLLNLGQQGPSPLWGGLRRRRHDAGHVVAALAFQSDVMTPMHQSRTVVVCWVPVSGWDRSGSLHTSAVHQKDQIVMTPVSQPEPWS
jgi:hypothetical protein